MSLRFNAILDTQPAERWPSVIKKTDFKQVLKFFRLLDDDFFDEEEKVYKTLTLFWDRLEDVPNDAKLFDYIYDFIACGEKATGGNSKQVFCHNADHGRVFAAFLQIYGIDLRQTEMHWFVFNELLNALPDVTKLSQVIELRGKKPDKNDSLEYKNELKKMQRIFAINKDDDDDSKKFFYGVG